MADFIDMLIQSESSGNYGARNDVPGSGGRGHFGRMQFSRGRLADAMRAGVIPEGTTPDEFLQNPEMQQAVERWHIQDIRNFIERNGLNDYVGRTINGVEVTPEGMIAVAHLGGQGGLRRFLQSGGEYNPADAYGTSLTTYLAMPFRGGERRTISEPAASTVQSGIMATPQGEQAVQAAVDEQRRNTSVGQFISGVRNQPTEVASRGATEDTTTVPEDAAPQQERSGGLFGGLGNLIFGPSSEERAAARAEQAAERQARLDELLASGEISEETYQGMTEQLLLDREFGGSDSGRGMGLANIMSYMDLTAPQYPSRLPTTIERGTPGSGTRAIQRLGIRPLV